MYTSKSGFLSEGSDLMAVGLAGRTQLHRTPYPDEPRATAHPGNFLSTGRGIANPLDSTRLDFKPVFDEI
jgi:hypothetical protein